MPVINEIMMDTEVRQEMTNFWSGAITWDVAMAPYSTIQAGGQAEAVITVETTTELSALLNWLTSHRLAWWVIGRGSNILVGDKGFDGVIILLGKSFRSLTWLAGDLEDSRTHVRIGGGYSLAALLKRCIEKNLTGLEFAVGIPGSIGGAVCMNAGAWGKSIGELITQITTVDRNGGVHEIAGDQLCFSYRQMKYLEDNLDDSVITSVCLAFEQGDQRTIKATCAEYLNKRKAKQPLGKPNVGSFFKNPAGDYAGRLIEAAGLKGLKCGAAMISHEHANFIINTGNASAKDITELASLVQDRVYQFAGIHLEAEVRIIE